MSGGWEVGDLALCVDGRPWWDDDFTKTVEGPPLNSFATVTGWFTDKHGDLMLLLKEYPDPSGWEAISFRKIKPDTEPCEDEFTTLIKRGRKVDA